MGVCGFELIAGEWVVLCRVVFFFFQAENGIRGWAWSHVLWEVYNGLGCVRGLCGVVDMNRGLVCVWGVWYGVWMICGMVCVWGVWYLLRMHFGSGRRSSVCSAWWTLCGY